MLEQVIVLSLLNSGVRRGELAGLTWKDVNFEECTIHISKSLLVFKDFGYQLTTTKESNIRDVDVAPEYMDFLKEYYKYWKSQKKLMGGSWQKSLDKKSSKYAPSLLALRGTDFVICNDHGFPINPDSYGALVRRIGQRAGIEGLHPHMFRHTFVSILLSLIHIYAFARQVSRYHAYHSLDDPAFSAESYLLVPTPTPAEIIERQQHLVNINHTILALSPKQAKRCYDYFYCGISMPSIAEKEGTTVGSVSGSIKSALINLREKCNLFIKP